MKVFSLTFEEAVAIVIIYGHKRSGPYSEAGAGIKDELYNEAWSMIERKTEDALERYQRFDERNK